MSESVNIALGVAEVLKAMGGLPTWGQIAWFLIIGVNLPYITGAAMVIFILRRQGSQLDKTLEIYQTHDGANAARLERAIELYENNAALVEDFSKLADSMRKIAEDQQSWLVMNTRTLEKLTQSVRTNQFCPNHRTDKETVEVAKQ